MKKDKTKREKEKETQNKNTLGFDTVVVAHITTTITIISTNIQRHDQAFNNFNDLVALRAMAQSLECKIKTKHNNDFLTF